MKMKKSNRYNGFWNSSAPLTSKRGAHVLSDPIQAEALIDAVRKSRSTGKSSVSIKVNFSSQMAMEIAGM